MKAKFSILLALLVTVSGYSQTPVVSSSTSPEVSLDVAVRGRQAVSGELVKQVALVRIKYSGESVVAGYQNEWYFDLDMLASMGYVHRGMFTELSDALASQTFSGKVVRTPQGYYNVLVEVTYFTKDGRIAMTGYGSLDIRTHADGTLSAEPFRPWMYMSQIEVVVPGMINAAKWVGKIWGQGEDLGFHFDGANTHIVVPTRMLENGMIALADMNGNVGAWDLKTGAYQFGRELIASIGKSSSSDIRSLVNPASLDFSEFQFFQDNGYIFGRIPLTDLVTSTGMKEVINFGIPIWGSKRVIAPSSIYVTPVYVNEKGGGSLPEEIEFPLIWSSDAGGWIINLPPGGYHIRVQFDTVLDWDNNPWGKG